MAIQIPSYNYIIIHRSSSIIVNLVTHSSQQREIFDHFEHYSIRCNLDYRDFNYRGTFFGRGHPDNRGPPVCTLMQDTMQ